MPRKTSRHHQRLVTIPIHPTLGQALVGGVVPNAPQPMQNADSFEDGCGGLRTSRPTVGPVLPMIAEMYGRMPEATFHSLRHTFVSFSANAGVPLHIVQSIVGHESTAMTRHYYHESVDALRSAVNAIPALG